MTLEENRSWRLASLALRTREQALDRLLAIRAGASLGPLNAVGSLNELAAAADD
jgi:hypothetical protein